MKQLLVGFTLVALIGCGGGGGGGDAGPADGAIPSPTPDGRGNAEVNPGAPDTGGVETAVPASDAGGGDSAPVAPLDDLGKPQLTGMDGITGTVNGKTYAYFRNAKATDYGTEFKSLMLKADAPAAGDSWTITIPKKTGTFPCGRNGDMENGMIALVGGPANLGTAYGVGASGCTVEVKSVVGHIEGRFVANLLGFLGSQNFVTSGYFYFARGLADCANAKDPGLAAGANGATLAISKVLGGEVYFRCGDNLTLAPLSANPLQPYLSWKGRWDNRDVELSIENLAGTGTFNCGQPGSALPNAGKVKMKVGEFYFIEEGTGAGSCTINVSQFDGTAVAGTYSGTLWNSYTAQHREITYSGTFRIARTPPP